MRDIVVPRQKPKADGQRELVADGVRRKPPISAQQALGGALPPPPPLASDMVSSKSIGNSRPNSIASSEGVVAIDDIDDDITTTGSDSYGHDDSSTNEGNPIYGHNYNKKQKKKEKKRARHLAAGSAERTTIPEWSIIMIYYY